MPSAANIFPSLQVFLLLKILMVLFTSLSKGFFVSHISPPDRDNGRSWQKEKIDQWLLLVQELPNIETKVSHKLILSKHMKLHKPAKKPGRRENEMPCLQFSDVCNLTCHSSAPPLANWS